MFETISRGTPVSKWWMENNCPYIPTCNMVGIVFKLKIKGHTILKQDREVSVVRRPMSRKASLRLVHS